MNHLSRYYMKRTAIFFLIVSCILSCSRPDRFEDISSLAIFGNSDKGESFSGTYEIYDIGVDNASGQLRLKARPYEFAYAPTSPSEVDALWVSVLYGKLATRASKAEAFAYEQLTERTRPLMIQFERYRRQLIDSGKLDERSSRGFTAGFIPVYVKGTPSIQADGKLFGMPAGTDLTEWFRFGDGNVIGVFGIDYKMEERAGLVDAYQTASEYFTENRMLPLSLNLSTISIPEEITLSDYPAIRYVGDDPVKVTITFPVVFERYWEWCRALYSDPNAEEMFVTGSIRIEIPFLTRRD